MQLPRLTVESPLIDHSDYLVLDKQHLGGLVTGHVMRWHADIESFGQPFSITLISKETAFKTCGIYGPIPNDEVNRLG